MRGMNFSLYKKMFLAIDDNEVPEGITKSQARKQLLFSLAEDLERNYLNGHIDKENIEIVNRMDYIAKIKIPVYGIAGESTLWLTFLADCVQFNGLYIQY